MISVVGIIAAEMATGKDAIQQFGLFAESRPAVLGSRKYSSFVSHARVGPLTAKRQVSAAVATIDDAPAPPPLEPSAAATTIDEAPAPPLFEPSAQLGAMAPLGFFDPMGYTKVGDEEGFRKLRASELKHGRVAMMASIGLVGQHFIRFPGFESAPSGVQALGSPEGVVGVAALIFATPLVELAWRQEADREPGNFGDPFKVRMYTDEMRTKEISDGRMAMISVVGIIVAEMATGKDAIQQFGLFAESRPAALGSSNSSSSFVDQ